MFNGWTTISPGLALFIFIGVLIVSLLIAGFTSNPCRFDQTRTKIFMSCLAPLGIIVTFIFYYAVVSIQAIDQRQNVIAMTTELRKNLLTTVMDVLHDSHAKIPHFVSSLFPLINCQCQDNDAETHENNLLKHQISYKLFHLWESFIITAPFVDMDMTSFLIHFLQRAHSRQLHEQWLLCKFDFNQDTQDLGDMLFKEAGKIDHVHVDAFAAAAKRIEKDKDFLRIMFEEH